MNKRLLSKIAGLLSPAFVKLRLLQVLMVCAALMILIRLERLYNFSDDVFVQGAKAEQKAEEKKPEPAKKEEAPPAAKAAEPEAKKSEFPTDQKPKEGFTAENFDILSLSSEQVEVLRTLSKRHRDLVQRERSITEREATLQAIEQRLDQKTEELKKIQEYLQQLLGQKDEKEKESIKKLVQVYEKMKPTEAATILQELDLETLLNIMDEMKDTKVSGILAKMEPIRARYLTMELAQRRKKLEEKMQKDHEDDAEVAKLTPALGGPVPVPAAAPDVGKPVAANNEPQAVKAPAEDKNAKLVDEKTAKPATEPAPKADPAKPAPAKTESPKEDRSK